MLKWCFVVQSSTGVVLCSTEWCWSGTLYCREGRGQWGEGQSMELEWSWTGAGLELEWSWTGNGGLWMEWSWTLDGVELVSVMD